jgi:hypothetical protein
VIHFIPHIQGCHGSLALSTTYRVVNGIIVGIVVAVQFTCRGMCRLCIRSFVAVMNDWNRARWQCSRHVVRTVQSVRFVAAVTADEAFLLGIVPQSFVPAHHDTHDKHGTVLIRILLVLLAIHANDLKAARTRQDRIRVARAVCRNGLGCCRRPRWPRRAGISWVVAWHHHSNGLWNTGSQVTIDISGVLLVCLSVIQIVVAACRGSGGGGGAVLGDASNAVVFRPTTHTVDFIVFVAGADQSMPIPVDPRNGRIWWRVGHRIERGRERERELVACFKSEGYSIQPTIESLTPNPSIICTADSSTIPYIT